MRYLLLIVLIATVAACDRSPPPDPASTAEWEAADEAPAFHSRWMVLLSGSFNRPAVAVFDFATVVEGRTLHRRTAGWLARSGSWGTLVEATDTGEAMREPWRLFPQGDIRLVVGDGGDVEALVHRGDPAFRLLPAAPFADWESSDSVRIWLREADLQTPQGLIEGVMLDVQTTGSAGPATGTLQIFVTDGALLRLILTNGSEPGTWIAADEEIAAVEGVRITPPSVPADGGTGRNDPERSWRLSDSDGLLRGQLDLLGEPVQISAVSDHFGGARLQAVRGWIEIRGRRQQVFGLVRRTIP